MYVCIRLITATRRLTLEKGIVKFYLLSQCTHAMSAHSRLYHYECRTCVKTQCAACSASWWRRCRCRPPCRQGHARVPKNPSARHALRAFSIRADACGARAILLPLAVRRRCREHPTLSAHVVTIGRSVINRHSCNNYLYRNIYYILGIFFFL